MSLSTFSQNTILVELRDSETNEPVSYATIKFNGTSRGLIADYNGQFRIPKTNTNNLSHLNISSLGYKNLIVPLDSLSFPKLNILRLIPHIENLDTVILNTSRNNNNNIDANGIREALVNSKQMQALEIVKKAVDFIKFNLNSKPHSYLGYYRDYQVLSNGEYFNLNEGLLEQFDQGIMSNKLTNQKNKAALYFFKKNQEFSLNQDLDRQYDEVSKYIKKADILPFGGNELSILNAHNPIRLFRTRSFSFVYVMKKDFLLNHFFSKGEINIKEGDPIITIHLSSIESQKKTGHKAIGIINISLKDFSIYNFRYSMYDSNKLSPLYNVSIEYQKINGKMYPNYMTFNNRFVVIDDDVFKEDKILFDKESNAFTVIFNRDINRKSIKSKRFKILYKKRRIPISNITILDDRTVNLELPNWEMELRSIKKQTSDDLEIIIKGVTDKNKNEIYQPINKIAYQFREFFVQEVFERMPLPENLIFIDKLKPLKDSYINDYLNISKYIINSPLMNRNF